MSSEPSRPRTKAIADMDLSVTGRNRAYLDIYNTVDEAIALVPVAHATHAVRPARYGKHSDWIAAMYSIAKRQGWKLRNTGNDPDLGENEAWIWVIKK